MHSCDGVWGEVSSLHREKRSDKKAVPPPRKIFRLFLPKNGVFICTLETCFENNCLKRVFCMSSARNLKLRRGQQGKGAKRTITFFVNGPNVDFIFVVVCIKICSGVQEQSPCLGGSGKRSSPGAKTLLGFGHAMEAANLTVFNI